MTRDASDAHESCSDPQSVTGETTDKESNLRKNDSTDKESTLRKIDSTIDSQLEITNYLEVQATPLVQHLDTALRDAIYGAPVTQLQQLLVEITQTNAEARDHVSARLLVSVSGVTNKRRAFETCIKCGSDYRVNDNESDDCVYHSGLQIT